MDVHDSAKLELRRQADLRRNLRSGLSNLPQPKNDYQVVIQPEPEDSEEPEEKIEEDMSDRIARERAEEEARQQALLKKRSKVLQRELPRPPAASVELIKSSLMRADEDKSSFVPPTLIEQADEMIRKELLSLLDHDNAKYPLEEKGNKEIKKGVKRASNRKSVSVPTIEDFEEDEMKEADYLIKGEAQFLHVAMGHEDESFDEFVEAHKTCLNDIMYFPTRNAFGLSSVAGNMEKLSALQYELENVKKRMDDDTKKAQRMEQKIKLLTNGYQTCFIIYQMRSTSIWSQIEATFKQMDTAGTEVECFQALQKQEQVAASHRINSLWEEVQQQKELERTLQKRYGDLIAEQELIQSLMDANRVQEEIAAKNRAHELATAAANETVAPSSETTEPVDLSNNEIPSQDMDNANESPKHDMLINEMSENAAPDMDVSSSDIIPSATEADVGMLEGTDSYEGSVSFADTKLNSVVNSDPTEGDDTKMADDSDRVNGTVNGDLTSTDIVEEDLASKDENGTQTGGLTGPEDIVQVDTFLLFDVSCPRIVSLFLLYIDEFLGSNSVTMVTGRVDLRSDTVTKPSEAMQAAMANAEVDDDVFGYDPTALRLETEMARLTGKEAAVFVPSGTMGNLISVLVHCEIRGSEVILGDKSHIHIYENGGISTIGGVHPRTVKNNEDGTMDIDLIEAAIRDPKLDIIYPVTRLICLENTHASCGGKCLSVEYTDRVGDLAKKHGLKLHIDGARIFNASVALGVPVHRLVQAADSVSVCLSKGLGAPVGSVIVGSKAFIARARTLRKTLGGGMRQVGVLCAAALVAVQHNVGKLEGDHKKAKSLAEGLNGIKGLKVDVSSVETNIIFFDILERANITAPKLCENLEEHGILVLPESSSRIRLVLHYQISETDVPYTLSCIRVMDYEASFYPGPIGINLLFKTATQVPFIPILQKAVMGVPDENGGITGK
ncbi:hypothetical protein RHMOL_Rhmol05G0235200 [Rhododendron molle]|nr:hypothetical protein RHMOL_Rhmol05G0235200 [Rhododendron molle]